jgi:tripartite-type tricarboxylate transporter receptor subunit TctC
MRKTSLAMALLAILLVPAATAQADTYPSHPITLMVGFPPGGPTDALARLLAKGMEAKLRQPIVVETVAGASGTIATGRVVHARPDGYTIGIGNWTSHVGSPAIYALDYDVRNDLQPIALLAYSPLWILGKNAIPPKTATELIEWLKDRPVPTTFGTVGAGSAGHICGLFFAQKTGARFQYVPYHGAGPAIADLLGGEIDLACLETSSTLPYVQAGRFKGFAVMSEQRWPKSPDTPTMIESGIPGLSISFWHGLWATKGTPQPAVDRLGAAVQSALADPTIRDRLTQLGQVLFPADQQNPAALAAYQKAEIDKWWPIIKTAGIRASE